MTRARRTPKFRVGQVVVCQDCPGFHIIDERWFGKKFPIGFVPGMPLYQLHPDRYLTDEVGSLMARESELRPLTRKEAGR